jgi:hypothetical protein
MGDGWRASYRVHPAADAFPPLDEDGLRELARDLERHREILVAVERAIRDPEAGVDPSGLLRAP